MTLPILSRHLVSPDFVFTQINFDTGEVLTVNFEDFSAMVDYWKFLLVEKYQAQHGQTVIIEFNLTNIYYFSAVFAAWELGLILIVDWLHAHSEQDCHGKTFTIHGKIDHAIVYSEQLNPSSIFYSQWDVHRTRIHCNNIITEKDFDNYKIQNHNNFKTVAQSVYAQPDSQAIWTATSGSTGDPKQQKIDHRSVFLQAERLVKHLNFKPHDRVLHTINLHHGASACYHFLPSLMAAHKHYVLNSPSDTQEQNQILSNVIIDQQINKLFLYTPSKLLSWLRSTTKLNHTVEITTLYYCTKEIVELAKEKNIKKINSVFGDTTIAYGFLIKTVNPDDPLDNYEPNCIGPKLDNFFDFEIRDGHLYIRSTGLGKTDWQTSYDNFELKDNKYYFLGRGTNYRINDEWINHHEIESKVHELFTIDHDDGATIIVDNEQQQVYLAVWVDNVDAERKLDQWLSQRYKNVYITKRIHNLNKNQFVGSRKVSRQLLKEYFRSRVKQVVNIADSPWSLN